MRQRACGGDGPTAEGRTEAEGEGLPDSHCAFSPSRIEQDQLAEGYMLKYVGSVTLMQGGLYDDWVEVLADPEPTLASGSYPAGTRDGTYGLGALAFNETKARPTRLVVLACDHERTVLNASYAQVGLDIWEVGKIWPEAPAFTAWRSSPDYVPYGGNMEPMS